MDKRSEQTAHQRRRIDGKWAFNVNAIKMQIKTKMRNHYTEMAKIQKKNLRLCVSGEDVDPQEFSFIIGGMQHGTVLQFGEEFGSYL